MQGVLSRAAGAIVGYFFRPGFEYQLGVARIFLYLTVLWTCINQIALFSAFGWPSDFLAGNPEFYPFGLMRLYGGRPPAGLVDAAAVIGPIAAIFAVVGFATKPSMIISTLSALLLVYVREGVDSYWSHGYNVVFYCTLPFMFGPAGSVLSVDRWLRRRYPAWPFGKPVPETEYSWPVIAALIGACALFYGAFWAKLYWGGPIAWWDSDNLRFDLAVTWLAYDPMTVPWFVEKIWSTPALYKASALLHLLMQIAPLAVLFSLRKPIARLVEGVFYAGSIIGLGIFMGLWHAPWFMLLSLFVDWDYLAKRSKPLVPTASVRPITAALVLIPLLCYFAVMHAVFLFQRYKTNLYPLSPLAFYSSVRAYPPYDKHQHYNDVRCEFAVKVPSCAAIGLPDSGISTLTGHILSRDTMSCHDGEVRYRYFNLTYARYCLRATTPEKMKAALVGARAMMNHLPSVAASRLAWRYSIPTPHIAIGDISMRIQNIQYPAYPEPIDPVVTREGLRASLSSDGTLQTATAKVKTGERPGIVVDPHGFTNPSVTIMYQADILARDGSQTLEPLPGHWDEGVFLIDATKVMRPAFFTIKVRDADKEYTFNDPSWIY